MRLCNCGLCLSRTTSFGLSSASAAHQGSLCAAALREGSLGLLFRGVLSVKAFHRRSDMTRLNLYFYAKLEMGDL